MALSRFEPLLSHKTSRPTGYRERIVKPSCFYHRKYSSISRFDRPAKWTTYSHSPCICPGRFKQLAWTPGLTTQGCTCPRWCVCKTNCGLATFLVAYPPPKYNPSTGSCYSLPTTCCTITCSCCYFKHHCNLPFCCCIPRPKSSPTKSTKRTPSFMSKLSCNCWRRLVGCCSCPARDILYSCELVSNHCCCAWCRRKCQEPASKPTCCCSGKGCTACCRRQAQLLTKALCFSSWLDEPFSRSVPAVKAEGSFSSERRYCCCFNKGIHTFCLSTSQGEKRLDSLRRLRCICCSCKPEKLGSSSGLEEICVCPPWSGCKQKSTMVEATETCPCCSYPLSGIIKPSTSADASPLVSIGANPTKAEEPYIFPRSVEDDFACPHWCTCKSEHRKLRKSPQSNEETKFDFNKAEEYLSGKRMTFDRIDLEVDSDEFLGDFCNCGKVDLDSDSDDSFRTCADNDLVRTSDSDSDLDLDCFGQTTSKPIRRSGSKARDVTFLCSRPTINVRL